VLYSKRVGEGVNASFVSWAGGSGRRQIRKLMGESFEGEFAVRLAKALGELVG
jgi:hypothetical protein